MKKVLIVFLVICVAGIGTYFYVFHKPHRDIAGESAEMDVQAAMLVDEYSSDRVAADEQYLDQVIMVQGVVVEVDSTHLKLESGIYCDMHKDTDVSGLMEGDAIAVKGRVVGYDELFGEVRLDNCTLAQ